jgi:signal transduction histidine kinase
VKADPARFEQVLWNLLKNAAKFTPERGDIYVTVSAIVEDRVRVQVRDTGIGIAPDFSRVSSTPSRKTTST